MPSRITPSLTFDGQAEGAMRFYTSLFVDAQIARIDRYHAGEHRPWEETRFSR